MKTGILALAMVALALVATACGNKGKEGSAGAAAQVPVPPVVVPSGPVPDLNQGMQQIDVRAFLRRDTELRLERSGSDQRVVRADLQIYRNRMNQRAFQLKIRFQNGGRDLRVGTVLLNEQTSAVFLQGVGALQLGRLADGQVCGLAVVPYANDSVRLLLCKRANWNQDSDNGGHHGGWGRDR